MPNYARSKFHKQWQDTRLAMAGVGIGVADISDKLTLADDFDKRLGKLEAGAVSRDDIARLEASLLDAIAAASKATAVQFAEVEKAASADRDRIAALEKLTGPKQAWSYVGQFLTTGVKIDGSLIRVAITNPYITVGCDSTESIRRKAGVKPSARELGRFQEELHRADPENAPDLLELKSLIAALNVLDRDDDRNAQPASS